MSKFFKTTISILLIAAAGAAAALWWISTPSMIEFAGPPKAIGAATPVTVRIANPHGIRHLRVSLVQGGTGATILETTRPADRFTFWQTAAPAEEVQFTAGKETVPGLEEGPARLVVEAQSNDFRGMTTRVTADVEVILRPPTLSTDGEQHYINQGGSELVTFTPSGSWSEAGVHVGDRTFRSFPAADGGERRLSLFAYSWDTPTDTKPVVFARNEAGQEAVTEISATVFGHRFRERELTIDDAFLNKVVNQVDPGGSGTLLERFLKINGQMRRGNNQTLADLRVKTEARFLWSKPFLQLRNSQVESAFADVRTYIYQGEKVDEQVHLGFDLATVQHGPVIAANDGRVIWAMPLGIYGNCIVLDHGFGLQSIYGHLSEINVKEGEMVRRGQVMGRTGSTGLAGGDHLHFSMQVDGVQVNPVEWWDGHWIQDHIWSRIGQPQ